MDTMYFTAVGSPVGRLLLTGSRQSLTGLWTNGHAVTPAGRRDERRFTEEVAQLEAYFAGELQRFDILLEATGTPFQQRVWDELRNIDYAGTIAYAELARRIGRPGAARAVGAACARNPIAIVVPCHRVVGSDGSLTGYAGGVDTKRALLALERGSFGPDVMVASRQTAI